MVFFVSWRLERERYFGRSEKGRRDRDRKPNGIPMVDMAERRSFEDVHSRHGDKRDHQRHDHKKQNQNPHKNKGRRDRDKSNQDGYHEHFPKLSLWWKAKHDAKSCYEKNVIHEGTIKRRDEFSLDFIKYYIFHIPKIPLKTKIQHKYIFIYSRISFLNHIL